MIGMRSVYSSHVDAVGYDPDNAELHVRYKTGGTTVYAGVSATVAADILGAASVGKALHENVRGKYQFRDLQDG